MLLLIIAFIAVLRPSDIHLLIMLLDEISNLSNLPVIENAAILENSVTIALDEELG